MIRLEGKYQVARLSMVDSGESDKQILIDGKTLWEFLGKPTETPGGKYRIQILPFFENEEIHATREYTGGHPYDYRCSNCGFPYASYEGYYRWYEKCGGCGATLGILKSAHVGNE